MNEITEAEKAYIAGFFDGEGCISLSRYQGKNNRTPVYQLHVVIGQKTRVLFDLCEICGVGGVYHNNKVGYGEIFQWTIPPRDAVDFLKEILPYLRNKAAEAELAIEFQEKQGHKLSGGRGWTVPQELIDEKERYYLLLKGMKGASGGDGGRGRRRK